MLTISKYLNGGSPVSCRNCTQPFPMAANNCRGFLFPGDKKETFW
jgi:hypothetical protein